jgi:hypothetical protein
VRDLGLAEARVARAHAHRAPHGPRRAAAAGRSGRARRRVAHRLEQRDRGRVRGRGVAVVVGRRLRARRYAVVRARLAERAPEGRESARRASSRSSRRVVAVWFGASARTRTRAVPNASMRGGAGARSGSLGDGPRVVGRVRAALNRTRLVEQRADAPHLLVLGRGGARRLVEHAPHRVAALGGERGVLGEGAALRRAPVVARRARTRRGRGGRGVARRVRVIGVRRRRPARRARRGGRGRAWGGSSAARAALDPTSVASCVRVSQSAAAAPRGVLTKPLRATREVVGSARLGAALPGVSDVDVVVTCDGGGAARVDARAFLAAIAERVRAGAAGARARPREARVCCAAGRALPVLTVRERAGGPEVDVLVAGAADGGGTVRTAASERHSRARRHRRARRRRRRDGRSRRARRRARRGRRRSRAAAARAARARCVRGRAAARQDVGAVARGGRRYLHA